MKSFPIIKHSKNPSNQLGEFPIFKTFQKSFLKSNYNLEIKTLLKLQKQLLEIKKVIETKLENTKQFST